MCLSSPFLSLHVKRRKKFPGKPQLLPGNYFWLISHSSSSHDCKHLTWLLLLVVANSWNLDMERLVLEIYLYLSFTPWVPWTWEACYVCSICIPEHGNHCLRNKLQCTCRSSESCRHFCPWLALFSKKWPDLHSRAWRFWVPPVVRCSRLFPSTPRPEAKPATKATKSMPWNHLRWRRRWKRNVWAKWHEARQRWPFSKATKRRLHLDMRRQTPWWAKQARL